MINLFEIEPEKIYGIAANEQFKEQKINKCINSDTYTASLKKDGQYHRYVSMNGEAKIQSRGKSVKTGTFGEVQDKVPEIYSFLKTVVPDNSLLIGELYFHNGTTNDVGTILRCLPAKAIARQKDKPLIFYIHDVWFWDGENLMIKTKLERNKKLLEIEKYFEQNGLSLLERPVIEFARYVDTVDSIKELLNYAFDNNEEGIVLTLKNSTVSPGTRTAWKTLKIKKELQNDADVFMTGNFKEPNMKYDGLDIENWKYWINVKTGEKLEGQHYRNYINGMSLEPVTKPYFMGWPGSVEIAVINDEDNQVISVGWISGLSDDIKQDFALNNDKYKNRVCRVNAMETTEDFKFRHARFLGFRDDITVNDCTFNKIFKK